MKKAYIMTLAALMILGCNKIENPIVTDNGIMRFNVEYPITKATETAFEAGDKIGVYITGYENDKPLALQLGGNYKNNIPIIFDGSQWVATPTIYWSGGKYDVFAYYPLGTPSSVNEMTFSIALDQTIEETDNTLSAYEASDFLYAFKKGVTANDGSVDLQFKHKMSKFTVNIIKGEDFEGNIPSEMTVLIHNTVTGSLIDLATGDIVKAPYESAKTIRAKRVSSSQYTAIVVPQMLTSKKPLVELIFNDVSYMIESKFHFKTGVHHTLNITLNKNPDKVKIEIGGEIDNGWE